MEQALSTDLTPANIVTFIAGIFEQQGAEEYLGEPVTIGEHMLQCAWFAEKADEPEEIVVAALLHDIGHFTSELGTFETNDIEDRLHEEAGAKVLEKLFPQLIVDCVRHHVAAKRYLCATRPAYFKRLSEASVISLKLQGGPMSDEEVAVFEKNPNLADIVRVRHYDEAGKRVGLETREFSDYVPMIQRVVDAHCNGKPE